MVFFDFLGGMKVKARFVFPAPGKDHNPAKSTWMTFQRLLKISRVGKGHLLADLLTWITNKSPY